MGLIGAAAITAVGAVGATALGNKGASNAAKATQTAADTSAQVQRDIYAQNKNALDPYIQAGTPATQSINALLGLGGDQQAANTAFDQYRGSTGYDFRMKQGMNSLNSGYAGAGSIHSGAAMKSAINYGQGQASNEFGNYLGALGNQQGVGFDAARALSGNGGNYANSLGNIYMQNGENQANAALVKSNNTGNALGSIFNTAGQYLGGTVGGGFNPNSPGFMARTNTGLSQIQTASPFNNQTNDWRTW